MSVKTVAARRLPPSGASVKAREEFEHFLTQLSFYDTLMSETTGSNVTDMVKKRKQEDILKYIHSFHPRTVSQMTSGRYAGCWQTRVGEGRENSRYIRSRSLEELLEKLAEYYGLQLSSEIRETTLDSYFPHWLEWKADRNNNKSGTAHHNLNC